MFIVLEGPDACGKDTQAKLIQMFLGESCVVIGFPRYQTALGQAILKHLKRDIAVTRYGSADIAPEDAMIFQCMMTVDKYDGARKIQKYLNEGRDVVCVRWHHSAEVYGASEGLDPQWLVDIGSCLPRPPKTLNVYLEISEEEALKRRPNLRDRYESDRKRQLDVRRRYREMWESRGQKEPLSWVIVNAEQSERKVCSDILWAASKLT